MVEQVGSVKIVGEIDVSSIKAGLESMKNGLDEAKIAARGAFGDLKRVGDSVSGIAGPLGVIGVALGSTMLGIAALSPAVAPALARMDADFKRLSRTLGDELKPAFEEAEESFSGFVDWMDGDGRPIIQGFNTVLTEMIIGVQGWAGEWLTNLKEFSEFVEAIKNTVLPTVPSPETNIKEDFGLRTPNEMVSRMLPFGPLLQPKEFGEAVAELGENIGQTVQTMSRGVGAIEQVIMQGIEYSIQQSPIYQFMKYANIV